MNIKEIKEMLKLMSDHNLLELEMEKDGMRIRLKKESNAPVISSAQPIITPQQISITQEPVQQGSAPASSTTAIEIKAPMVGTFYRAPSPEAPPYVESGRSVDIGQVVCIIEAMKLMNEIKSEVKGKIVEIFVENGQPIEFGQPLFLIEPS